MSLFHILLNHVWIYLDLYHATRLVFCYCKLPCILHAQPIYVSTDRDECTEKNDTCAANETCVNTIGSYSCNCAPGYTGEAGNCQGYLLVVIYTGRYTQYSILSLWFFFALLSPLCSVNNTTKIVYWMCSLWCNSVVCFVNKLRSVQFTLSRVSLFCNP